MAIVDIGTQPHFPTHKIYDPAAAIPVQGASSNESLIARVPRIVTVEGMAGGTTIDVQVKVHTSAAWVSHVVLDGANEAEQSVTFDPRWNFVRLVRTGAQDMIAYVQV